MDLTDKKVIKDILTQNKIRPKESFGQNFLTDKNVLEKILHTAKISQKDTVLEVGPGLGVLTVELSEAANFVITVEADENMAKILKQNIFGVKNVKIVHSSILELKEDFFTKLGLYKIVSNLPYNITSIFLRKILTLENKPKEITVMLQKEIVERICALPGKMSLLALSVQVYGRPKLEAVVPKTSFWPVPKVDSAILSIKNIRNKKETADFLDGILEKDFFRTARIGFSAKRKQLQKNFANGLHIPQKDAQKILEKLKIDTKARAQELNIEQWKSLAKHCQKFFSQ